MSGFAFILKCTSAINLGLPSRKGLSDGRVADLWTTNDKLLLAFCFKA